LIRTWHLGATGLVGSADIPAKNWI
jgi:hypothetical protein